MVDVTAPPRESLRRNWYAIASLWLVVASWLALTLRIYLWTIFELNSALDWLYVGAMFGAVVSGIAGLISIRTRGDGWLAGLAFGLSLVMPACYALFFFALMLLWGVVGGGSGTGGAD